jgi:uncharacterized FlaG/YvyC family protein
MDTVTKVGVPSVLGPTHQSDPASAKPDTGAPDSKLKELEAQQAAEAAKAQAKQSDNGVVDEFLKNLRNATTRLRIDHDDIGVFVYKSIDRLSGEVKGQYPNEDYLRKLSYLAELNSKKRGTTV